MTTATAKRKAYKAAEREPDALEVYCGKHDDEGYAVWWTYLPPQIGKTYTNGDPEGQI